MKTSSSSSNHIFASFVTSILVLLCSLSLVTGLLSNADAATLQVQVAPNGSLTFSPASVSIQPGDTVEWIWKSSGHSSTSGTAGVPNMPNMLWDSGVQNAGFTFFHTFSTSVASPFGYYCTPHGACCNMVGSVNVAGANATPTPSPSPIPKGTVRVQLSQVASGLTAPGGVVSPRDGSGRLFIVQQTGQVLILKSGSVGATPFLDVSSRLVSLTPSYDERGLLGFAFHPDFNNSSAPGFHKIYTYTSEPVSGTADFTVTDPNAFDNQSVIAEWKVSDANPDAIDPATRREIIRIDHPQSNHNAGQLAFRAADHYLYISEGDGGNANDVGPGHNPGGNAQDKSVVLGKILRIDPLDPALTTGSPDPVSANGKYRVPASNPFVGQTGSVAEIYVYGLRNPYRFSFDATLNQLVIGDVGQNNIEEVDLGVSGKNYGWNKKEGSYLFNSATGNISPDPAADSSLTEPVAEYSHTDGTAVIGGFVYRGVLLPALSGKYVFGDLAQGTSGRLFYADLTNGVIQELLLGIPDTPLGMYLKGFGQDASGELYVAADSHIGPSGTGGKIFKIVTIQPATANSVKVHGGTPFGVDLLAANPAIEPRGLGTTNDYQVVMTFSNAISFTGATVTPGNSGTASLSGAPSPSPDNKTVTINLTNVSNAQNVTVTLLGVNDSTNSYDTSLQMGVLLGDVNGDGQVDSSDLLKVKQQTLQPVNDNPGTSNFREDVNADGNIDSSDLIITKRQTLTGLPPSQ
jgi:glucose/arabinose dehydrogenase